MLGDRRKYGTMEQVLQKINQNYVALPDAEVKKNTEILNSILQQLIAKMKVEDELFNALYQNIFYGGSYYDGLRVGNPEEFDLDLLFILPKVAEPVVESSNIPGYVRAKLKAFDKLEKTPEFINKYRKLATLLDDKKYLSTSKLLRWMEGIMSKVLNGINSNINVPNHGTYNITCSKGGPAMTLKVSKGSFKMDVDFVASFKFDKNMWPQGYRFAPGQSNWEFFIVPKSPKTTPSNEGPERYWRLSFQIQERMYMKEYNQLKPVTRLMKKLRDENKHAQIASYFIKTVLMWEIEKRDKEFWKNSGLGLVFMEVLKSYKTYIDTKNIPYFWNKKNNLIGTVDGIVLENISGRLKTIIDTVEKKLSETPQDPFAIAQFLIKKDDIEKLRREVKIGKLNSQQSLENSLNSSSEDSSEGALIFFEDAESTNLEVNTKECSKSLDLLMPDSQEPLTPSQELLELAYKTENILTISNVTSEDEIDAQGDFQNRNDCLQMNGRLKNCTTLQIIEEKLDTMQRTNQIVVDKLNDVLQKFDILEKKYQHLEDAFEELKEENRMLNAKLTNTAPSVPEEDKVDKFVHNLLIPTIEKNLLEFQKQCGKL